MVNFAESASTTLKQPARNVVSAEESAPSPPETWDVHPPSGWEPVGDICRTMFAERDGITERIVAQIRQQVEPLDEMAKVEGLSGIVWATRGGITTFLRGVARCEPPNEDDLEFQRVVGQLAAIDEAPLQPLITAYQVAFRELWVILTTHAADTPAAALLLERGSIVWERLVAITSAVADGYQQEMATQEAHRLNAASELLDLLDQDPSGSAVTEAARYLGFQPHGTFQVLVVEGPGPMLDVGRFLTARIQEIGAMAHATLRDRAAVVISQGADLEAMDSWLEKLPPRTAIGVGETRPGTLGAQESLREALSAIGLARAREGVSRFEDEWLLALVVSQRETTAGMLKEGIGLAGVKPHLAEAVRAFVECRFSVAESARMLTISPNSLRYRLIKWRELTGWDPWTFDGLAKTLVAIGLASIDESGDSDR